MLSKLARFASTSAAAITDARAHVEPISLENFYGDALDDPVRVAGGTLGVSFLARIDGQRRFFKTNAFKDGRSRLEMEFSLLEVLYGARLELERLELPDIGGSRLWIVMSALSDVPEDIAPDRIASITEGLARSLLEPRARSAVPVGDDFIRLIEIGELALASLTNTRLLTPDTARQVKTALAVLRRAEPGLERRICHGDLGPRNIMTDADGPVVVDWEDAFCGFHGYDRLYWLTFFQNRKYMVRENLGFTALGLEFEVAVLVLVILLKCHLAFASGSNLNHSLDFEGRLREVFTVVG